MKRLVILGAGESGVGTALLGKAKGYDVFVSDLGAVKESYANELTEAGISWEEKQHTKDLILNADVVVKSPGIPEKVQLIQDLLSNDIPVVSEIEFAGQFSNGKHVCITGSNGKTTTTLITYHILKKAGLKVAVCGNVGESYARKVLEDAYDVYVLELSSFQLDGMYNFRADIAMLLNITPDHLDRYDYDFQKYIDSKFRIIQNQTEKDVFIYWYDDEVIQKELKKREIKAQQMPFSLETKIEGNGAYLDTEKEEIFINHNKHQITMSIHDLATKGKHNVGNNMAASIASKVLEIRKEIIRESLSDFQNVEHRLEYVARVHGIEFINDSKATNINSTWYALESVQNEVVWIVGGVDKGNDYSELEELVSDRVKAIVCLGKDNQKIVDSFSGIVPEIIEASSMEEAVSHSYRLAKKNDTVLLSPACASFDLFENYEERGQEFKKWVKAL